MKTEETKETKIAQIEEKLSKNKYLLNYFHLEQEDIDYDQSVDEIITQLKNDYTIYVKEEVYKRLEGQGDELYEFAKTLSFNVYRDIDEIVENIKDLYDEFWEEIQRIEKTNNFLDRWLKQKQIYKY